MLKGVNLGGWLVLERWITPSLFEGFQAKDETEFCLEAVESKKARLKKHRDSFIKESDFKWLAGRGLNAARVPVPHWVFGGLEPYVGCIEYLENAFKWAQTSGLKIIIGIHTAPGSQNGWDHSGKAGDIAWHKNPQNINQSLEIIEKLAAKFAKNPALAGIELLNEPHWKIPQRILTDFYERGYEAVRRHCKERVAVIISDGFRPYQLVHALSGPGYKNVILDRHFYQCFDWRDKRLGITGHLKKAEAGWRAEIERLQEIMPLIAGEWSLGLDPKTFKDMDEENKKKSQEAYGQSQLQGFSGSAGWFFWTYKTEKMPAWNFRHCVETGLLPEKF